MGAKEAGEGIVKSVFVGFLATRTEIQEALGTDPQNTDLNYLALLSWRMTRQLLSVVPDPPIGDLLDAMTPFIFVGILALYPGVSAEFFNEFFPNRYAGYDAACPFGKENDQESAWPIIHRLEASCRQNRVSIPVEDVFTYSLDPKLNFRLLHAFCGAWVAINQALDKME